MKRNQFKYIMKKEFENDQMFSIINEQNEQQNKTTQELIDCNPKDITLDSIVTISQQLNDNTIKSFDFNVIEVWLKPDNMYTIVNVKKERTQKNYWILFYDDNCFYLKKGTKGPIGVHCQLKETKEE